MPTARPRHQVTETEAVARALDLAARRWPTESRGKLLVRLIEAGAESVEVRETHSLEARSRILDELAGTFAGVYPVGYLDDLRQDWPE